MTVKNEGAAHHDKMKMLVEHLEPSMGENYGFLGPNHKP